MLIYHQQTYDDTALIINLASLMGTSEQLGDDSMGDILGDLLCTLPFV